MVITKKGEFMENKFKFPKFLIPEDIQCVIVITYDTDVAGGYAPPGVKCHGRTPPFLMKYIDILCDTADNYGIKLQFFQIANGLEIKEVVSHLQKVMDRGHAVDCHGYDHLNPATTPSDLIDEDLEKADLLFEKKLGFKPYILRAPGGYPHNSLSEEIQRIILKHGYKVISGEVDHGIYKKDEDYFISSPMRSKPFYYPTGLLEIPISGWTDRMWFDNYKCINSAKYNEWKKEYGHSPVPENWKCPWTSNNALGEWIDLQIKTLDFVYKNRLIWVLCFHPYSHYLHDPKNKTLPSLIEYAFKKPKRVLFCTMRELINNFMQN